MDLREIDRLVAEKVMGWHRDKDGDWYLPATHEGKLYPAYAGIPEYSTDIAAAWEVLMALKHLHPRLSYCDTTMSWSVQWTKPRGLSKTMTCGETDWNAPLVICLAALKAKGVEVPG